MCLAHKQDKPKRSQRGKSSATRKPRRERSVAKLRKTVEKTSGSGHQRRHLSSHNKAPAVSTIAFQPGGASNKINAGDAAKDAALPVIASSQESIPPSVASSSHQRTCKSKRSISTLSRTGNDSSNSKHRHVVSHDYHDHASFPPTDDISPMNEETGYMYVDEDLHQPTPDPVTSTTSNRGSHHGSALETFPYRLYRMIEDAHAEGNRDIIQFMPHGRAFRVEDQDALVDQLLPRYFHQSKYVSFQRQLSIYGFQKLMASGPDRGVYMYMSFDFVVLCCIVALCA
jgi:hypothetical protein